MIAFDLRSLFFITGLLSLLCAIILLIMRRSFPPSIGGLTQWAWSSIGAVLATFLLGMHGTIPALFSVVVATGILIGSTILVYTGMAEYAGRKTSLRPLLLLLTVAVCWSAWFTFIHPSYPTRVAMIAMVQAILLFAAARILLASSSMLACRFTGGLLLVIAALSAARSVGIVTGIDTANSLFAPTLAQNIYAGAFSLSILALTVGMMMLANDRLRAELEYLVAHDTLSGAFSRATFMNLLSMELDRAQRSGRPLTILMCDLDKFKSINDRHGHLVGDRVIVDFVATAKSQLRRHDSIGRYGGEEFIALLPETAPADAHAVAQRICASTAANRAEGLPAYTVSIGIATASPDAPLQLDALLEAADRALYQAKQNGRNRVETAVPAAMLPEAPLQA